MKFAPYRIRKRLGEIVAPDAVNVTDVSKLKAGLSSKIWDQGGILKPEVRKKMIELAKEFYAFLNIQYPIKDIYFTGSLANYNWTSHSDVDVHVMFDTKYEEESELLSDYIFAKKEIWSDKHNITIYGFPVELFAKNAEEEHGSKAIYSLMQNKWIKKPSKKNVHIDSEAIQIKTADLMNKIDDIEKETDNSKKFKAAEILKDKIKNMRKASLEAGGEYSTENLVFKTLRNNGYLDKLGDLKTTSFDAQMSLNESVIRENANTPIDFGVLMLFFNIPNWKEIAKIKPEDVYSEDGRGIEDEPHVTALYGFHDEVTLDDVKKIVKKVVNKPLTVKVIGISTFSSKDKPYDVVKFDIESKELERLNTKLKKLPHTNTFSEYHPHITISYVKKGTGEKYNKIFEHPILITGDKMVFSDKEKNKTSWTLIKRNILKVQKDIPGMTPKKINILKDFINFTCAKLQMKEPVTVVIRKDRDQYISTTASYLPNENENHIRAGGRAIVDICRSIGHELTHNRQRELGLFKPGEEVQNIGGKIEDEANSIAGILIKDFSHNYGYDNIYENKHSKNNIL